jgi:hypothetical protein
MRSVYWEWRWGERMAAHLPGNKLFALYQGSTLQAAEKVSID